MNTTDGLPIKFVEDAADFKKLCDGWQTSEFLALDTEFERTNTFYPRIGLLQLADDSACYLIDPTRIDDWSNFRDLITKSGCAFVIHSCSEDLNLLHTVLDCVPAIVFDTQLAAAFLGLGYSISYQALVREILNIDVLKDETRSDWLKRPLSDKQIVYAAADVNHLQSLQRSLKQRLLAKNMLRWFETECHHQLAIAAENELEKNWQILYSGVSNAWRLNDTGLSYLQKLCYWREQEARERDKPRYWIAKDNDLLNIAKQLSQSDKLSLDSLVLNSRLNEKLIARYGSMFLHLLNANDSNFVQVDRKLLNTPIPPSLRKKLKDCQQLVNEKATELGMAPELLGRKKQLLELVRSFDQGGELSWGRELSNWRREILEPDINRIMSGEVRNET